MIPKNVKYLAVPWSCHYTQCTCRNVIKAAQIPVYIFIRPCRDCRLHRNGNFASTTPPLRPSSLHFCRFSCCRCNFTAEIYLDSALGFISSTDQIHTLDGDCRKLGTSLPVDLQITSLSSELMLWWIIHISLYTFPISSIHTEGTVISPIFKVKDANL